MKIKLEILQKVNNPQSRNRIGVKLGIGEQAVAVQMRNNTEDGRLTKMDALTAIADEVGTASISDIIDYSEDDVPGYVDQDHSD